MKKYIPFIPIIGAIIVAYNPLEDYGLSNSTNRISSAILQGISITLLITIIIL